MTKTVTIRPALLSKITVVIDRLNRRAAKLGVDPISLEVGMKRIELIKDEITGRENAFEVCDVTISLNIPKLADWEFISTIQHLDGANILLTVPGQEACDLSFFRTCPPKCCHCNLERNRADTYVVRHTATGTLKQVGKNCLADFTGYGKTPEQAAAYAEWLSKLAGCFDNLESGDGEMDEGSFGGGPAREGFGLNTFLAYVVACSRIHGFRTGKQAQEDALTGRGSMSTKQDALFNMEPPPGKRDGVIIPTDEDRAFAIEARSWATKIEAASDFDHNLKTIASMDGCLYRNAGIAAYIVQGYRKHLGNVAKRATLPESRHFGEVKARIRELQLIYLGNASFDSQYGVTFIHRFRTPEGHDAIWKTGDEGCFREGETYTVDATVKQHGDYKGRPQTVLTRIKCTGSNPAPSASGLQSA